jgi:hypothetical protein
LRRVAQCPHAFGPLEKCSKQAIERGAKWR